MAEVGWQSWIGYEEENSGNAPANSGSNIWGTGATALRPIPYLINSLDLRRMYDAIMPDARMQGHRSPITALQGIETVEGSITAYLYPTILRRLLKNWFGLAESNDSAAVALQTLKPILAGAVIAATQSLTNALSGTITRTSDATSVDGTINSQLKFTLSSAAVGTIKIVGKDRQNNAVSETIITAGGTNTVYYSKLFYKSVDASGLTTTVIADGARTWTVDASTMRRLYVYKPGTSNNWLSSLTIEAVKGNIPVVYRGCLINSGTIRFQDIPEVTFNIIGKDAKADGSGVIIQNVAGGTTPTTFPGLPTTADGGRVAGAIYNKDSARETFVGWSNTVKIGGTAYNLVSAEFTLNNQGVYPDNLFGSRLKRLPIFNGEREVTLTLSLPSEEVNLETTAFTAGVHEVVLQVATLGAGKPYETLILTLPRAQYISTGDYAVTTKGQIIRTVNYRCLAKAGSSDDEAQIELLTREDHDV